MQGTNNNESSHPWYRHRWPWLLILPPLASVIGGLGLVYQAVSTPNPLVVDDYADISRHIERRLERDEVAARLGLVARLSSSALPGGNDGQLIELEFSHAPAELPERLSLRLLHPTLEHLDQTLALERVGEQYRAVTKAMVASRYYLLVEPVDRSWRLTGELAGPGPVLLSPPPGLADKGESG